MAHKTENIYFLAFYKSLLILVVETWMPFTEFDSHVEVSELGCIMTRAVFREDDSSWGEGSQIRERGRELPLWPMILCK